ncbi:hypothetical protein [Frigoriglobus tundricola]|uniref:hypothetical protein n=1 Tax=Frigoriglobus tundricola TaxID=2774151 RepID=UPI00148ECB07|nr:hypothetical protein [Frigoriglobus tundricola]
MSEAHELRALIDGAPAIGAHGRHLTRPGVTLRVMRGVNSGFGTTDCAGLNLNAG